ncbi:nucleotide sugar dehydrogenase [Alicyclobacillus macrosporangiidus]|uniref:nucleotide sugar dehydrogenase n=1 Tax=Alicyclobacillus macrosporangiidus TaxID=392015 RepID=UPI000494E169|nr:nucleotide sugar dehydrogenase [Alicyclobacillus macrosporangiidus]
MGDHVFQRVCVVGQGFVGLPLAVAFASSGVHVVGIDIDARKVQELNAGKSPIADVPDQSLQSLLWAGRISFTTDIGRIAGADAVLICVPTPLNDRGAPDLTYILEAAKSISRHLSKGQLIVLESSTFPGTTEEILIPILETYGMRAGEDFYVAYSPERINPGETFDLRRIPKVVGGVTQASLERAVDLYRLVFEQVVPTSSTRVAEFTKLLENTQRFINISMMNQLAVLCHQTGLDLWEAIAAAATKPYGFVPYYPGPGVGGHCIPVDPMYLKWYADRSRCTLDLVDAANKINHFMPAFVAERIVSLSDVEQPRVLIVGVTYKRDVNDTRESASLRVLEELAQRSATTAYHDPLVPEIRVCGQEQRSTPLTAQTVSSFDVVAILTDHSNVDYELIQKHARNVLDCRGVYKTKSPNVHTL